MIALEAEGSWLVVGWKREQELNVRRQRVECRCGARGARARSQKSAPEQRLPVHRYLDFNMASSRSGGVGGLTSDDVGDMRGRVQLMNDDRKALMESTQSIIKQNKELLKYEALVHACMQMVSFMLSQVFKIREQGASRCTVGFAAAVVQEGKER